MVVARSGGCHRQDSVEIMLTWQWELGEGPLAARQPSLR